MATTLPVSVRGLTVDDVRAADRIFRLAFGTYLGVPEPKTFAGDADIIGTRLRAGNTGIGAFHAANDLIGSNIVSEWGSVGFLGPLTTRPDLWDQGIAKKLLEPTVALFDERGTRLAGLFTFAQSVKHVGLYQRFGFWPQYLTSVFELNVSGTSTSIRPWEAFSDASRVDDALAGCRTVADTIYDGLDVSREIMAVIDQQLGETVLLADDAGIEAFAVCHIGPSTEAGSNRCYVKVAAVRPGPNARRSFGDLLDACEDLAVRRGTGIVTLGANTARWEAYTELQRRGYRAQMNGVIMTRPKDYGYNRPGVYMIDDWR